MAMFDSLSSISKYSPFDGGAGSRIIWGKVISNKDPKMLARIKIQIKDLMPYDDKDKLPWVYPLYPAGLGQGPGTVPQCIPEEETFVGCIFPNDSIYMGYYAWQTVDRLRRATDFLPEYPERYGWQDSRGNKFIVNKDPAVDTVEHFFGDGGHLSYDNRNSHTSYHDPFGTHLFMDRKTQTLVLEYGGVKIQIENGTLKIDALDSIIQRAVEKILLNTQGDITLKAKSISNNATTISNNSANFHGNTDTIV